MHHDLLELLLSYKIKVSHHQPIAEDQLRASLMMSDGNLAEILTRPYALLFLALAVLTIIWPNIARRIRQNSNSKRDLS